MELPLLQFINQSVIIILWLNLLHLKHRLISSSDRPRLLNALRLSLDAILISLSNLRLVHGFRLILVKSRGFRDFGPVDVVHGHLFAHVTRSLVGFALD